MGFYQEHCIYLPAMAGWFVFSAFLSSYNKYVFGSGHLSFPCPLLMTSIHFFAQWVFAETLCALFPERFGAERITNMTWKEWISVSVPCGLVTSGDIGLSNMSLVTITITFYTMVKASTPIFVLGWAYLFSIERITWTLVLVVFIIAVGEFLTVLGEVEFDMTGFLMCLGASVLSGARWTLVQLKLQSMEPKLKTTIATMRLLAPSMFLSMIIVSLIIERPWIKLQGNDMEDSLRMLGLGLFGAFFAISMIICEFYLVLHASAIILMIGGVIKEMITIFVGVTFFGDPLNAMNVMGCLVVFGGVVVYKVAYHLEKAAADEGLDHLSDRGDNELLTSRRDDVNYMHVESGDDDAEARYGNDKDWDGLREDTSEAGMRSRDNGIELRKQHQVANGSSGGDAAADTFEVADDKVIT